MAERPILLMCGFCEEYTVHTKHNGYIVCVDCGHITCKIAGMEPETQRIKKEPPR